MLLAGVGSTFLGPFLPTLVTTWHLADKQAALLLSTFFVGSFLGTLLLSRFIERTLRAGSLCASAALILFAAAIRFTSTFYYALAALALFGFGLGQLMSSMNMIAGSASAERRASLLAKIGAAWCAGAVLSPAFTTPLLPQISPSARLMLLAPLFLLPAVRAAGCILDRPVQLLVEENTSLLGSNRLHPAATWGITFFIYGGVEACIAGWMPSFATRYQLRAFTGAQWIASVFWLGLIAGRAATARFVNPDREATLLRSALSGSLLGVFGLLLVPSPAGFLLACAVTGACLGHVFPLTFSSAVGCNLGTRALGGVLAACGLGAAALPYVLGVVSSGHGLRAAMLVPICGLATFSRTLPAETNAPNRKAYIRNFVRSSRNGITLSGRPMAAIRMIDIARDLGVSTVTVSKVLRDHPDIGQATKERVLKRVKELGYRPNLLARGLVTGKTSLIAYIVPDLIHSFFLKSRSRCPIPCARQDTRSSSPGRRKNPSCSTAR